MDLHWIQLFLNQRGQKRLALGCLFSIGPLLSSAVQTTKFQQAPKTQVKAGTMDDAPNKNISSIDEHPIISFIQDWKKDHIYIKEGIFQYKDDSLQETIICKKRKSPDRYGNEQYDVYMVSDDQLINIGYIWGNRVSNHSLDIPTEWTNFRKPGVKYVVKVSFSDTEIRLDDNIFNKIWPPVENNIKMNEYLKNLDISMKITTTNKRKLAEETAKKEEIKKKAEEIEYFINVFPVNVILIVNYEQEYIKQDVPYYLKEKTKIQNEFIQLLKNRKNDLNSEFWKKVEEKMNNSIDLMPRSKGNIVRKKYLEIKSKI